MTINLRNKRHIGLGCYKIEIEKSDKGRKCLVSYFLARDTEALRLSLIACTQRRREREIDRERERERERERKRERSVCVCVCMCM